MRPKIQGFEAETFLRRRSEVVKALQGGVLLLPAAPVRFRSRDTEYLYRPDSELFYLTGCTEPGAVAVLSGTGGGEAFILFLPERDARAERWSGPRLGPGEAREMFGADAAYTTAEMGERLRRILEGTRTVYFRLGTGSAVEDLVLDALGFARSRGARTGLGPRAVVDPGRVLDDMRLRKDPEEVARIRQAAALTVDSFLEVMPNVHPGLGEWEVQALLEAAFRKRGARGPAFPTIVGSGPNACVLHYTANDHVVDPGALVLLDGGVEMGLYSGDVTRTIPAGGTFSLEQRAVYEVVLRAHAAAVGAIGPGVAIVEVHRAAVGALTEGMLDLGVLSGSVDELLENEAYERFFPHQTSHWLGLDVHDVGDYARDGVSRILEPGMVLTVEPGLYLSPGDDSLPAPFRGIGVRVEDDLLVTEAGSENLTGDLPVEADDLEALIRG